MSIVNNNNQVLEINEASSAMNEMDNEANRAAEKAPVDENMFFATGTFSIHHQPSGSDDEVFMGE